jgi:hypothetical protein
VFTVRRTERLPARGQRHHATLPVRYCASVCVCVRAAAVWYMKLLLPAACRSLERPARIKATPWNGPRARASPVRARAALLQQCARASCKPAAAAASERPAGRAPNELFVCAVRSIYATRYVCARLRALCVRTFCCRVCARAPPVVAVATAAAA